MKKKYFWLSSTLLFSSLSLAAAVPYEEFIEKVLDNSVSIRIARNAIEIEKFRTVAGEYYYSPVITTTYEHENSNENRDDFLETNEAIIKAEIKLYSSDVIYQIKELHLKEMEAYNNLNIESESAKLSTLKNLMSIHYYERLKIFAINLNEVSMDLSERIRIQFENGTASENDVTRTELLISRIDNEINIINRQINLLKSNIELVATFPYPQGGVALGDKLINQIENFSISEDRLASNLSYISLRLKKDIAIIVAEQQDPLFSINAIGEQAYRSSNGWSDDSKITLNAEINIFSLDKRQERLALKQTVETNLLEMDLKMTELKNSFQTLLLLENSHLQELDSLRLQIKQTEELIAAHPNEYSIGKVSLYEMLNTQFDLFISNKQKSELNIEFAQNKIDMMQLTGQL